jgi:hypothetical protein
MDLQKRLAPLEIKAICKQLPDLPDGPAKSFFSCCRFFFYKLIAPNVLQEGEECR